MIIRPATIMRNDYNLISEYAHQSGEIVYLTKYGKGDLVVRLGGLNLDSMYKKGWKIPETFSVSTSIIPFFISSRISSLVILYTASVFSLLSHKKLSSPLYSV